MRREMVPKQKQDNKCGEINIYFFSPWRRGMDAVEKKVLSFLLMYRNVHTTGIFTQFISTFSFCLALFFCRRFFPHFYCIFFNSFFFWPFFCAFIFGEVGNFLVTKTNNKLSCLFALIRLLILQQ